MQACHACPPSKTIHCFLPYKWLLANFEHNEDILSSFVCVWTCLHHGVHYTFLYTLFQQPVLGQMVLAPCDISITLTGAPGISGGSEIAVDMGVVVFTVSTATVRLILNVLKPLQQDQVSLTKAGCDCFTSIN